MISQRYLKQVLSYNKQTGVFVWKRRLNKYTRNRVGMVAGGVGKNRYHRVQIGDTRYYGHQLAWYYVYGYWAEEIDHKDRNKSNNAIDNLRDATHSQNSANRITISKLGIRGVQKRTENCYSARIKVRGTTLRLGHFRTASEASAAYITAAKQHFGEFANV